MTIDRKTEERLEQRAYEILSWASIHNFDWVIVQIEDIGDGQFAVEIIETGSGPEPEDETLNRDNSLIIVLTTDLTDEDGEYEIQEDFGFIDRVAQDFICRVEKMTAALDQDRSN